VENRRIDNPIVVPRALSYLVYQNWNAEVSGRDREAFLSSSAYIVGMLTSTVFGVYPNVLPAVDPANSLTIQNASASTYGMTVGLIWRSIGMVLAAVYFTEHPYKAYARVVVSHAEWSTTLTKQALTRPSR
jgi:cytochrome bd-type quinol oxidase subunit 2